MIYRVVLSDPALDDLDGISAWIEERAGQQVAEAYDARLRAHIAKLAECPRRGRPDDDISAGLRTLSFERRLRIAYRVEGETVEIYRVFHGARDARNI